MYCEWATNLFEIYFALYFVTRGLTEPLLYEYVRALKYNTEHGTACGTEHGSTTCNVTTGEQLQPVPEEWAIFESCSEKHDEAHVLLYDKVNEETSVRLLQVSTTELGPTVVIVVLMATLSDFTLRRRFLVWLPCLGQVMFASAILLDFYSPVLRNLGVFIGALLSGLSGGPTVFMVGTAAYFCDMVDAKKRTWRFLAVEILSEAAGAICWPAGVMWIRTSGFTGLLWLNFACSFLVFRIVYGSLDEAEIPNRDTREFNLGCFFTKMAKWTQKSTKKPRIRALLWILAALLTFTLAAVAFQQVKLLCMLSAPFCFNTQHLAVFFVVSKLYNILGLGLMMGLTVYYDDKTLAMVGIVSFATGSIVMWRAEHIWTIYVAALVLFLHKAPHGLLRSHISNFTKERIALAYSMLHSGHVIFHLASTIAFHYAFYVSHDTLKRLAFILIACLAVVPFFILGRLLYLEKKKSQKLDAMTTPRVDIESMGRRRRRGTVCPPQPSQLKLPDTKQRQLTVPIQYEV